MSLEIEIFKSQGDEFYSKAEFSKAILEYQKVLEEDPTNFYCSKKIGGALCNLLEFSKALTYYDKAIESSSHDLEIYFMKGATLIELFEYEKGIECYDQILVIDPHNSEAHVHRGECLRYLMRFEEALLDFRRAEELNQDDLSVYLSKGVTFYQMHNYEKALECFEYITLRNNYHSLAHYNKGLVYLAQQKIIEALLAFQEAINTRPDDSFTFKLRAYIFKIKGMEEEAIKYYLKAIERNPYDLELYILAGAEFYESENFEAAIEMYDRGLKIFPEDQNLIYNKAISLIPQGKIRQAIQEYEKLLGVQILRIPSQNEEIQNREGLIEPQRGELIPEEIPIVEQEIEKEIATFENEPQIEEPSISDRNIPLAAIEPYLELLTQGISLLKENKFNEAIKPFKEANLLKPECIIIYFYLAKVHRGIRHDDKAISELKNASIISKEGNSELNCLNSSEEIILNNIIDIDKDIAALQIRKNTNSVKGPLQKLQNEFLIIIDSYIEIILNKSAPKNTNELASKISGLMEEIKNLKDPLYSQKSELRKELEKLEKESSKYYEYCKMFYWIEFHYIWIYREFYGSLMTFQENNTSEKESIINQGLKNAQNFSAHLVNCQNFSLKNFLGIESSIQALFQNFNREKIQSKVKILAEYVIKLDMNEEEASLILLKSALAVTRLKIDSEKNYNDEKYKDKLYLLDQTISAFFSNDSTGGSDSLSPFQKPPIQDFIIITSYIFKNKETLLPGVELDELFRILLMAGYEPMIEDLSQSEKSTSKKHIPENDAACAIKCSIF